MEVDVTWNDRDLGYDVNHYVPDMAMIDPAEGNSDEEGFYTYAVRDILLDELESLGVVEEAIVAGC